MGVRSKCQQNALRRGGGSWPGRGAWTTTSAPPPALTHGHQSCHGCTYTGCNHPLEKQEGRHSNTSSALSYLTRAQLLFCSMLTDGQFANFSNSGKIQNSTESRSCWERQRSYTLCIVLLLANTVKCCMFQPQFLSASLWHFSASYYATHLEITAIQEKKMDKWTKPHP